MSKNKKLIVGICVTGREEYWALAVTTLVSLKTYLDIRPSRILIATDQNDKFSLLKQLQVELNCEISRIVPRSFYKDLVPKMKGNYATYWKFDLFHALGDDEVLMYVDIDAFAIRPLRVTNIIEIFADGEFHMAAVPSPRPVLERVAATRIKNPFDYFNAGVLFGVKDSRYEKSSIMDAYNAIMKFDTLNVFWHDQDIFNFLFRSDTFKLPYSYNIHTGYIMSKFSAPHLVNVLASEDMDRNGKVAHVSGDYLLSRRYHPYKHHFVKLIDTSWGVLATAKVLEATEWSEVRLALWRLRENATRISTDYLLQCSRLRKRTFAEHFYLPVVKSAFRKVKRFVKSIFFIFL